MSLSKDIQNKQKTAHTNKTAEGVNMEQNPPKVGDQSANNVEFKPVTRNQSFTVKNVPWNSKSKAGY